jgi:hypothetical protein
MRPAERFREKAAGVAAAGLEYGNETLIEAISAALADAVETERAELKAAILARYPPSHQSRAQMMPRSEMWKMIDARPKVRE